MNIQKGCKSTREIYAGLGVDVGAAVGRLKNIPASMHCWQGDDVMRFEDTDSLSGDIQTTGNYPGKARNPREFMTDIGRALSLISDKHRTGLHASYAIFTDGRKVGHDALEPKHFTKWMELAGKRGLGLDFGPTMFSHSRVENTTLPSEDPGIRKFWISHCKTYVRISQYFAEELGSLCSVNIWTLDGFKDIPADRMSPRARLKDSLSQILTANYDKSKVLIAVESKVFGTGMESCTVGSHRFYTNYTATRGIMCLLDSGHFHPTEMISDKISSMLLFSDKVALHVSRPVRWDSNHVVLFDDETREVAKEIVRNDPDRVLLTLDFFDASVNRIYVWVVSTRNVQEALLYVLLMPNEKLTKLQEERGFTELIMKQEGLEAHPFGDVWDYFCQINQVLVEEQQFKEAEIYEEEVLSKRR